MADNFRFSQLQSFQLAGAGAVIGDTTIVLSSMLSIDGDALSMANDFGAIGFGTLEPNSGTQEEQISFTGLVNNANGTTTLTGVSNVSFLYPYTQTSGLAKTHAGGVSFVISNTSGFYDKLTSKSDDETITGLWDFPSGANNPTIGSVTYVAPTEDTQIATKKYVDDVAVSGAPNANLTTKGILQEAATADINAGTQAGSTGAELAVNPFYLSTSIYNTQLPTSSQKAGLVGDVGTPSATNTYATQQGIQNGSETYAVTTGSSNAYAAVFSPVPPTYKAGQKFIAKANFTNTGSVSFAVNGQLAKTIKKLDGVTDLVASDITNGQIFEVAYDGTNFQMLSPAGILLYNTSVHSYDMTSASGTDSFAHGLGKVPKYIRLTGVNAATSGNKAVNMSVGTYNGTHTAMVYNALNVQPSQAFNASVDNIILHLSGFGGTGVDTDFQTAVPTFDATNITLTWTKTNSPTGTAQILWEAFS